MTFLIPALLSVACQSTRDAAPANAKTSIARDTDSTGHAGSATISAISPVSVPSTPRLLENLRQAFQLKNSRLANVRVLERLGWSSPDTESLVLAHAIRADQNFAGNFSDELFCVFKTSARDSVTDVVECVPTPRWNDYTFRFEAIDRDSIVLMGTDGYGFQGSRVIRWHAEHVPRYARPEPPWVGAVVEFADTGEMDLYGELEGEKKPVALRYEGALDYGMRVIEARGNWLRVVVWVPSMPGCDNELDRPVTTDTLWTLLERDGHRLLRRAVIGPC